MWGRARSGRRAPSRRPRRCAARQHGVGAPSRRRPPRAPRRPGSRSASAAAPNPTMPRTFSSPPRRARSCSPPTTKGSTRRPRRTTRAPDPRRAPQFVGAHRHEVGAELVEGQWQVPGRRARVDVHAARRAGGTRRRPRRRAGRCPPRGWRAGSARARRAALSRAPPSVKASLDGGGVDAPEAVDGETHHRRRHAPTRRGPRSAPPRRARSGRPGRARVAPHVAALTASVPPEVNTTWRGRVPSSGGDLLAGRLHAWRGRCGLRCGPGPGHRSRARPPTRASRSWPPPLRGAAARSRRGRGSGGARAQTSAAQASSPRAREDSTTGIGASAALAAQPGQEPPHHARGRPRRSRGAGWRPRRRGSARPPRRSTRPGPRRGRRTRGR